MIRTFGIQTVSGAAQPLFGDKLTAAFSNLKDNQGLYYLTVANSAIYEIGDRWILGVGSGSPTNCALVDHIVDATHVAVASEGNAPLSAWANSTVLMLDIACSQITLQSMVGNAGNIWAGADSTVTNTGGGSAFGQVTIGGSWAYGQGQWNTLRTSEFFFAGTLNDKVGNSALII